VFLNPPGGRVPAEHQHKGTASYATLWWNMLTQWSEVDFVEAAIFVGFSLEILRSTQAFDPSAMDFPYCVPRKRIAFDTINRVRKKGKRAGQLIVPGVPIGERVVGDQPTHANAIVFIPAYDGSTDLFDEVFSEFGKVQL